MKFVEKILRIDRRIIFILVGGAVVLPLLLPLRIPINITKRVKNVYESIDALPPHSPILISFDFEPDTAPELFPMSLAVVSHCFAKDLRVIGTTLYPAGAGLAEKVLKQASTEFHKEMWKDYVFLGYKPGNEAVILSLGENIGDIFPMDYYQIPIDKIPALKGVKNLTHIPMMVTIASSAYLSYWIRYGGARYHIPIAGGCTAVMAADYYPYLESGQLIGLIGGMKGAAEYESLVKRFGDASMGMDAQSIVHLLIVSLVILGNAFYLYQKKIGAK